MRISLLLCTLFATLTVAAQSNTHPKPLPLEQVTLLDSPFKRAEQLDIRYLLTLDADRLLAPYRKEAGLQPKAENYPNWENTGLDGHIGGHYLSALAQMYASTQNPEIGKRMNYMLDELEQCQATDGYLCGVPNGRKIWQEIASGDIRAGRFNLNGGWVPLYNIHKIFAGLRDAWHYTHDRRARRMLIALTDWMERTTDNLTDEQMQQMLYSEHGGLNEIFADVAALTNNKRYLRLAHRFSDNELLEPLLRGEDHLTGMHANTQIPKVIGYKRIAEVEGLTDWEQAAEYFWQQVVGHRTISIGGNSVREHFHPHTDFSSMLTSEQGPETCNTYNMLRLSKMLYCTSDDGRYIDYYEQALYNHILSSQHPVQGGLVYFTPMRAGHYRVYSQPHTSFWCCVGSGMENHARYGELIYAE
ncbi:MAG: glycoside hydrolase family 127 protein, partial [Tidjanibacter sp.]|nr:glycoside hydrolase family 127 protein [Tidjanibacter sp.]